MSTRRAEWTDGRDARVERKTLGEKQLSTLQALASRREGPSLQDKIHITRENGGERCEGEGRKLNGGCSVAEVLRTESRGADKGRHASHRK
jgi:hypothetical protein